jgi:integrase
LDVLAELYKWAAFQGHVPAGFNRVRAIPRRTRVRNRHYDHLDEYEAAALLEAMFELEGAITPRIMLTVILALVGVRPEEGARVTRRDANLNTGRWQILATKDQGRTELDDTRDVPIWPYDRAALEAFETSNGPRAPESRLCVSEGRKQRSGQEVATLGTVRVEMGHKSLLMLTRVYERVGDVRSRREVVEYRRPDGRLPGEDLLRQVLGERFDEIMGTGEARPTLRMVG